MSEQINVTKFLHRSKQPLSNSSPAVRRCGEDR